MAKKNQDDPKDPGWYPDPHSRRWSPTERFWDGSSWTGQTRLSGAIAAETAKKLAGDAKSRIEQEQLGEKAKQAGLSARAKIEEADIGGKANALAADVRRSRKKPLLVAITGATIVLLFFAAYGVLGGGSNPAGSEGSGRSDQEQQQSDLQAEACAEKMDAELNDGGSHQSHLELAQSLVRSTGYCDEYVSVMR